MLCIYIYIYVRTWTGQAAPQKRIDVQCRTQALLLIVTWHLLQEPKQTAAHPELVEELLRPAWANGQWQNSLE